MIGIVVVFPKREILLKFKTLLVKNGFEVSAICITGGQALQAMEELEGGVLISGIRFSDMIYTEILEYMPPNFEMVVIGSARQWQEYQEDGVKFLPLPLKGFDLIDTVSGLLSKVDRKMKAQKSKPKKRTEEEQNIINRAKMLLMKEYDYSEEEAHRFLQKRSMDNGVSIIETAHMVLDIF